jgi:hypothetical protein
MVVEKDEEDKGGDDKRRYVMFDRCLVDDDSVQFKAEL